MTKAIVTYLQALLGSNELVVGIISAIPIIEVRGAIPIAFASGMSPARTLLFSLTGSMLIIPLLLLFFYPILNALKKIKLVSKLAFGLEALFAKKAQSVYTQSVKLAKNRDSEGYKLLALMLFVAIPLPMTGVWSGCAIAVLLNLRFAPSLAVIALGNLSAGLVMTLLCWLFMAYLDLILFTFLLIAILAILVLLISSFLKKAKKL